MPKNAVKYIMQVPNKYVFLHIPKTCGSLVARLPDVRSISHVFFCKSITNHIDINDTGMKKGWEFMRDCPFGYLDPITCFTVLRNPFNYLGSYYYHENYHAVDREAGDGHKGWANCRNIHNFRTFEEFITAYCDPNFHWHAPLIKNNLFAQMYNSEGKCVPVKILFAENLIAGLESIGIAKPDWEPNLRDYREHYTDEMRAMVEEKCKNELKFFGYDFQGRTIDDICMVPDTDYKYDVLTNTWYFKGETIEHV